MKSEQTSVQWLWEQIDNTIPYQNIQTSQIFNGLLEQALVMFEEQIIDAYRSGKINQLENSELYYNQTFKSK
jgi:hypothetical protein